MCFVLIFDMCPKLIYACNRSGRLFNLKPLNLNLCCFVHKCAQTKT